MNCLRLLTIQVTVLWLPCSLYNKFLVIDVVSARIQLLGIFGALTANLSKSNQSIAAIKRLIAVVG